MTTERCQCSCHVGSVRALHVPPLLIDHVAAATACSRCQGAHLPALESEWPAPPRPNPLLLPWMDVYDDGEGAE